jgi:phosphatidate cytidylyltransferase
MSVVKVISGVVTALVIFVMLGVDYFTSTPWAFAAFTFLVLLVSQSELYTMLVSRDINAPRFIGLPLGAFFLAFAFMGPYSSTLLSGPATDSVLGWLGEELHWDRLCSLILAAGVVIPTVYALWSRRREQAFESAMATAFGLFYVVFLGSYLLRIRFQFHSQAIWFALLFVCTAKSNDIGGYLLGSTLGRHKLHSISPRKTIEGSIGGIAVGTGIAILVTRLFLAEEFPLYLSAVYGIVVCVMAQLGDLGESLIKRYCGQKDSGRLIPGSGGMLDFADCLLFSAPTAYYFVEFLVK